MERELREALVGAFTIGELEKLAADYLDERLEVLVAPGTLDDQAFELIQKCSARGWLGKLVAGVIVERPDRLPAKLARLARRIACVGTVRRGDQVLGAGFLVGPDLVLTSHEVLAPGLGGRAETLGFEVDGDVVAAIPEEPITSPPEALGFALFRLADDVGNRRGWIELPRTPHPFATDRGLAVAHRLDGAPLSLALDATAQATVDEEGNRVGYALPGSPRAAGAPVLGGDGTWALVALHLSAVDGGHGVPASRIAADPRVAAVLPTRPPGERWSPGQRPPWRRKLLIAAGIGGGLSAISLAAWAYFRDPECVVEVSQRRPPALGEWELLASTGGFEPWTLARVLHRTRDGGPDDSQLYCADEVVKEARALENSGYAPGTPAEHFRVTPAPAPEPFVFALSPSTALLGSDGSGAVAVPPASPGRLVVAVGLTTASVETRPTFERCMGGLAAGASYQWPDEFLIGALAVVEVATLEPREELTDALRLDFADCRVLHPQHRSASCEWACGVARAMRDADPQALARLGRPLTVIGVKRENVSF